jgi:CheY-like chemotaxis protein
MEAVELEQTDVVVMNLPMPVMDGYEATREIKAGRPQTKVLALSLDEPSRDRALEAGADASCPEVAQKQSYSRLFEGSPGPMADENVGIVRHPDDMNAPICLK